MTNELWFVGRLLEPYKGDLTAWGLMGIFENEEKARIACSTTEDFICPINLNEKQSDAMVAAPRSYYPLLKE